MRLDPEFILEQHTFEELRILAHDLGYDSSQTRKLIGELGIQHEEDLLAGFISGVLLELAGRGIPVGDWVAMSGGEDDRSGVFRPASPHGIIRAGV